MKTIIFSDTHLTTRFKPRKYKFLEGVIKDADKIIIAGDFWEGKLITFQEFLNSDWKNLFPILKQKHTIYVYGNHDKRKYSDKRVNLFSDRQNETITFKDGNKTFRVKHGDTKKIKYSLIKNLMKTTRMSEVFFMKHFHEDLEHLLTKLFGPQILQILFKKYNTVIKKLERNELEANEYLVCGHTHAAEIDLENHFINTGIIRHGIGQYVEIENGNITLKSKQY